MMQEADPIITTLIDYQRDELVLTRRSGAVVREPIEFLIAVETKAIDPSLEANQLRMKFRSGHTRIADRNEFDGEEAFFLRPTHETRQPASQDGARKK